MLDWMVEVMTQYKFTHKAYFAGIQLMDRYFEKETDQLHPSKLHIIGVVSMMISSKMEEVYPLKLKTVYEKIGHKKIP
jgi:phage anti-repressor protein